MITLKDLKDVISEESDVGLSDINSDDLPMVDTWGNWINELKTLDVEVERISSCAYILLELRIN